MLLLGRRLLSAPIATHFLSSRAVLKQMSTFATERTWGEDVIRIVCISDTHSYQRRNNVRIEVPSGDVLIHAGDFSSTGRLEECQAFREWMDSFPHKQKIVIAGNHDITMQQDYYVQLGMNMFHRALTLNDGFDPVPYATKSRALIATNGPNYTYLEDNECKLNHPVTQAETALSVYGSPWQPEFYNWAYNLPRGAALREKWEMIPTHTDVLITHGPPHGILDRASDGFLCGCQDMLEIVRTRVKPRLHVFGHIHEGYGTYFDGTTLFANPSTCTAHYRPTNPPLVIDLPLDPSQPAVLVQGPATGPVAAHVQYAAAATDVQG